MDEARAGVRPRLHILRILQIDARLLDGSESVDTVFGVKADRHILDRVLERGALAGRDNALISNNADGHVLFVALLLLVIRGCHPRCFPKSVPRAPLTHSESQRHGRWTRATTKVQREHRPKNRLRQPLDHVIRSFNEGPESRIRPIETGR